MKKIHFLIFTTLKFLLLVSISISQNTITDYQVDPAGFTQFEKSVFTLSVDANYNNPYDQHDIKLNMMFTTPSGEERKLPSFFNSEYESGSEWKAHFAPREVGEHSYYFELFVNGELTDTTEEDVIDVQSSDGDGFILKNSDPSDEWTLTYDSGTPFRGVGINIGWEHRSWDDPKYTYDYFFERLENAGANFVRTWMHAWNLPLDWQQVVSTNIYSDTDEYFNPGAIERMDELIELSENHGIYLMIALDAHGGFISDLEWPINRYNAENGGPANSPSEFFTLEEAKNKYKNRLRYLVGRWGYSTAIAVWELFNEIDNVRNAEQVSDFHIFQWHNEMSTYLKSIDPYDHLVSTSISHSEINNLFNVNDIDINQSHLYRETGNIPHVLTNHDTNRPYVIGEFGREWDWNLDFSAIEDEKIYDYKRGLWYGLFHSTPILPMSWWWEWFDDRDLFDYFSGVRLIMDMMLESGYGNFNLLESSFPSESYAIKTDSTIYAYINNIESSALNNVTLSISGADDYIFEAKLFDPETNEFEPLGNFSTSSGNVVIPEFNLGRHEQKIIILDPRESAENGEQPSSSFELNSNFPNPFNPSTNISFTVHETAGINLTIKVYDQTGRFIQQLADRQYFSHGTHEKSFKAENLSSGLYIYRVTGRGNEETGKMMLIK